MKKFLSILLCLLLLPVAWAEPAAQPGQRLVAEDITLSIGEETFAPELTVLLDALACTDGSLLSFCIDRAGEALLPVQMKDTADGFFVVLGDSQVYRFGPDWFEGEDFSSGAIEILLINHLADMPELFFSFADFLDSRTDDEFLLDAPLLTQWLLSEPLVNNEDALLMEEQTLPEIRVKRETGRYTLSVAGEMPINLYLTRTDMAVSLKCSDSDYSAGVQAFSDGSIQLSVHTSTLYARSTDINLVIKMRLTPQDEEKYDFSFTLDYDDACIYSDWGKLYIHLSAVLDDEFIHSAQLRLTDDNHLLGIPAGLQLNLHTEDSSVTDRISGKEARTVSVTGDGIDLLTFAAMGMMSDVEKLLADPTIESILDAYNTLFLEYYGEEFYDSFYT